MKCNQFGHLAVKCENTEKVEKKEKINWITSDDNEVIVQINNVHIPAILDTGSSKTLLREDEFRKIGNPTLQPTARMFKGFGNAQRRGLGVLNADLTINGVIYTNPVYVVPTEAMDSSMLLGKDVQKQMNINIDGGVITIKKKPAPSENATVQAKHIEEAQSNKHDENDQGLFTDELTTINYIEAGEVNVIKTYQEKIHKMIQEHVPKKQVQTDIETKIQLKDEDPVCLRPRRLSVKEKRILDQQIDEWLNDGIIQPSHSVYSSPVVIVDKKDGSHRVCIDYRQLNKKNHS